MNGETRDAAYWQRQYDAERRGRRRAEAALDAGIDAMLRLGRKDEVGTVAMVRTACERGFDAAGAGVVSERTAEAMLEEVKRGNAWRDKYQHLAEAVQVFEEAVGVVDHSNPAVMNLRAALRDGPPDGWVAGDCEGLDDE